MARSVFSHRYERLRQALVRARLDADLTQAALAKRLRRPQSFVSKYERGERRLDLVEFLEVMETLKTEPNQIIEQLRH